MATRPLNEADESMVVVRLSDIDYSIRYEVASLVIERGKLDGVDAQAFLMAAVMPNADCELPVPVEKALLVLREGRLPEGPMPKVWKDVKEW